MSNPGPAQASTVNLVSPFGTSAIIESINVTISPAAVTATTSAEQSYGLNAATFTTAATGILAGDVILSVSKPSAINPGLGIVGWRNDAATNDKFYVTWMNTSTGTLTPTASEVYTITVARKAQAASALTSISVGTAS